MSSVQRNPQALVRSASADLQVDRRRALPRRCPNAERALPGGEHRRYRGRFCSTLARADGVDFEEVCAEWRGGGHAADDQNLIACLCELAGEDGGLCLLDQSFKVAR